MDVFIWLIAVQAAGFAAFPLLFRLLPRIPDRGYGVSKPLGLLLLGYFSWILSQLHVLPSTQLTLLLILAAMAVASGAYAYRRRRSIAAFLRAEWRTVVAVELVFLLLFAGWAFLRAHDPGISHTEQPMDFSFLNASVRTFYGPPEDPWLRGEPVSYYYFGHWVAGAVAEFTGTATRVAYNLALASSAALAGAAAFGLAYNLVRWRGSDLRTAIGAGLLAAGLLTVCSNLEGTLELLRAAGGGSASLWSWIATDGLQGETGAYASWRPDDPWWWWRATRVINTFVDGRGIDYTIQEFPAFSYILGDLHAHVTSVPLVLLFLTLCLGLFTSRDLTPAMLRRDRLPSARWTPVAFVLLLGLTLGGVGFTNMWDLPVFAAAFLGLAFLRSYAQAGGSFPAAASRVAPVAALVIGLAFLFFLPYHLSFTSQFSGLHPVQEATTRPLHFAIVWGLLLFAAVPFVLSAFWQTSNLVRFQAAAALAVLIGFLPYLAWYFLHLENGGQVGDWWSRLAHVLPLAVLIVLAAYSTLWHATHKSPAPMVFTLALSTLGLILITVPELVYVGDLFQTRMNTVFKLYYQAWLLLSIAAAFAAYRWAAWWSSGTSRLAAGVLGAGFIVLLAASLYYTPVAALSKGEHGFEPLTLNGLAHVEWSRPAEYRAILRLQAEAPRGSAMVEAVAGDYSEYGRVSSSSGVPTVLGWPGHQHQWRSDASLYQGRFEDVARIYSTTDPAEAKVLLDKYDVQYVYVGYRELQSYGEAGLAKFEQIADVWFAENDVIVYEVRR